MLIVNVHERTYAVPSGVVAPFIDGLGSPRDQLWPRQNWPAMILEGGPVPGSSGGHGPVRYVVERRAGSSRGVPAFKHGRYSRYLPERLTQAYEAAQADEALVVMRDELALVDARLAELLGNVDREGFFQQWQHAKAAAEAEGLERIVRSYIDTTGTPNGFGAWKIGRLALAVTL